MAVVVVVGGLLLLAGCGSGSSSTPPTTTAAANAIVSHPASTTTKGAATGKPTAGSGGKPADRGAAGHSTREVNRPHRKRKIGKLLASAASYLGVGAQQLRFDEDRGKSFAQIADSTSGKSSDGLISALVASRQVQITAGVQSGQITQEEGSQLTASLIKRMTARVNRRPTQLALPKR